VHRLPVRQHTKLEATATTAEPDGQPRAKTVYRAGEAAGLLAAPLVVRTTSFSSSLYVKYDSKGRLEQEMHLAKDDSLINKIVYKYDSIGKHMGSSVFDANGKLISGSPSPAPSPSARKSRNALGR
jgi:hypothetical protein